MKVFYQGKKEKMLIIKREAEKNQLKLSCVESCLLQTIVPWDALKSGRYLGTI